MCTERRCGPVAPTRTRVRDARPHAGATRDARPHAGATHPACYIANGGRLMPSSAHITRRYHLRAILAAGTLAALALAPAARAGAATHTSHAASGPSGSLVVVIPYEPASLDPAVDYDGGGTTYLGAVYDGLLRGVGERQVKIVPDLALSWQQSRDGKTWTFHLRPHVKFHDGSTVDAAAVKFSFERFLKAGQGAAGAFAEISKIDV